MIKENIFTVIQISIISHILMENPVLRNPSRTLFYFLVQIRKLSLNIGGYLPNSDYTKITVTEKSYDFVTFGLWECHLIGYTPKGYVTIMRYYYLENVLQMSVSDILHKKNKDTKAHNFRIFNILKKNKDEHRL